MNILRFLVPALAAAVFATAGTAQITNVAGSGCPTFGYPSTTGTPSLGQQVSTQFTCSSRSEVPWLVIGTPAAPMALPTGLTCGRTCTLACTPAFALAGQIQNLSIPNDPSLVGGCLCLQYACQDVFFGCISLSGAVQLCVQP